MRGDKVIGGWIYGPPISRRGKIANRLRRALGMEERDEIYAHLTPSDDDQGITITWGADGIVRIGDDR